MDLIMRRNFYLAPASFVAVALLWSSGISFLFLLTLFATFAFAFLLSRLLLQNPDYGYWLQLVYLNIVYGQAEEVDRENRPEEQQQDGSSAKRRTAAERKASNLSSAKCDPLKLNANLNREMEDFFETLVEVYVNSWYTENISEDGSFVLEIRQLIRHSSAKIVKALVDADLQQICADHMLPAILTHIERISCLLQEHFPEQSAPLSLMELKILERWPDAHWATQSAEAHANYLRSLSDALVYKFVDDIRIGGVFVDEEYQEMLNREGAIPSTRKWSCHSSRHFLRELFFSIISPALDFVSDPDSLNRLGLLLLSKPQTTPSTDSEPPESGYASSLPDQHGEDGFLDKFATHQTYNQAPDSLLAIKLSDLIRDPQMTRSFVVYLRDLGGPVNYLDCFLQARDIHMHIQKLNNKSHDRTKREQYVNEIYSDSWQLFSTFVHTNSPNYIPFPRKLVDEFSQIVELKGNPASLKSLENVIESVYQEVYQYLQYNFVIPFCQSENYLGFLCGAPPEADELIRGTETAVSASKYYNLPEGSFSLSQFRKKLFNFITPSKDLLQPTTSTSTFYPSSSTSDLEAFGTGGEIFISTSADFDAENGNIALSDMGRDLNKWTVSIEGVEQNREDVANVFFLFSILIERNDFPDEYFTSRSVEASEEEASDDFEEKMPKVWMIRHRYEEFYALDDKLRAYYGNLLRLSPLPDRKTTLQLLRIGRNSRTLMESHRSHFERFLQQLLQQSVLKRSDLLYLFLTTEEDSNGIFELVEANIEGAGANNFLPDLNPIRAMRKVAKERGQNLKPFILNLLANVLAPPALRSSSIQQRQQNVPSPSNGMASIPSRLDELGVFNDDRRSLSSVSVQSQNQHKSQMRVLQSPPKEFPDSQSKDDDDVAVDDGQFGRLYWRRNIYDILLFFSTSLGLIYIPEWVEAILCSLKSFVGIIFALIFHKKMEETLEQNLLKVETATYLVKSLHEMVLFWNATNPSPSLGATPLSQISEASSSAHLLPNKENVQMNLRKRIATAHQRNSSSTGALVSDQERHLRAELLLHCLEKRLEELIPCSQMLRWLVTTVKAKQTTVDGSTETVVRRLFLCFQMPLLNRQMVFVLLDIIVERILIDSHKKNDLLK